MWLSTWDSVVCPSGAAYMELDQYNHTLVKVLCLGLISSQDEVDSVLIARVSWWGVQGREYLQELQLCVHPVFVDISSGCGWLVGPHRIVTGFQWHHLYYIEACMHLHTHETVLHGFDSHRSEIPFPFTQEPGNRITPWLWQSTLQRSHQMHYRESWTTFTPPSHS